MPALYKLKVKWCGEIGLAKSAGGMVGINIMDMPFSFL